MRLINNLYLYFYITMKTRKNCIRLHQHINLCQKNFSIKNVQKSKFLLDTSQTVLEKSMQLELILLISKQFCIKSYACFYITIKTIKSSIKLHQHTNLCWSKFWYKKRTNVQIVACALLEICDCTRTVGAFSMRTVRCFYQYRNNFV